MDYYLIKPIDESSIKLLYVILPIIKQNVNTLYALQKLLMIKLKLETRKLIIY